jgi:hypothetical protein
MRAAALLVLLVLAVPSCGSDGLAGASAQIVDAGGSEGGSSGGLQGGAGIAQTAGMGGQAGTGSEGDGSVESGSKSEAGGTSEAGATSDGAAGSTGLIHCKMQSDCPEGDHCCPQGFCGGCD